MSDSDSDTASSVGSIIEEASEPDTTSFKCLFCDEQCNRVAEMSSHCKSSHGFDLETTIKSLGPDADEIVIIKLINFLRMEAQKNTDPKSIKVGLDDLADEKYLQPALPEDALLFELGDLMPEFDSKAVDYDEYEAAMNREIPEGVAKLSSDNTRDDSYFESYKGAGIHREMIEDHVRTQGYRDFIEKNADVFAGKVVLDVGCGTGILSLFCARAGAKKVFAVDNSDIAHRAKEIIAHNGYRDRIQVIQGRAEDFNTQRLIGKEKVDIIISEWMGYGLLFEGMLDSVLRARDMYLKKDGIMVPSHTTLRLAPIADPEWIADTTGEKFWKEVHGFDFSPMIPNATLTAKEIGVFDVPQKSLCGSAFTFNVLDLAKITIEQLDFVVPFKTQLSRDVDAIEAFAIWFDTLFIPPGKDTDPAAELDWGVEGIPGVGFSTGPAGKPTHWHQAVLVLDKSIVESQKFKAGATLEGTIQYAKPRKDARGIDVTIKWQGKGEQGEVSGQVMRTM